MSNTVWEKVKRSLVFNIAIIIFAVFLGVSAVRTLWQVFDVREDSIREQDTLAELKEKKAELEARLRELETKEALEREAKARLNLKLPGEEVVVVLLPKKEEPVEVSAPPGFWERIKIKFNF